MNELNEESEYFCHSCKRLNDSLCPLTDGLLRGDESDAANVDVATVTIEKSLIQNNTHAERDSDTLAKRTVVGCILSGDLPTPTLNRDPPVPAPPPTHSTSPPRHNIRRLPSIVTKNSAITHTQADTRNHEVNNDNLTHTDTLTSSRMDISSHTTHNDIAQPNVTLQPTTQPSGTIPKQRQRKKPPQQSEENEQLNLTKSLVNNLERKLSDLENTNKILKAELNSRKHVDDSKRNVYATPQPNALNAFVMGSPPATNVQYNTNIQMETELTLLKNKVQSLEMDSLRQRLMTIERAMLQTPVVNQQIQPPPYIGLGPYTQPPPLQHPVYNRPIQPLPYMGLGPYTQPPPYVCYNNHARQFNIPAQPVMVAAPHMYYAPRQRQAYHAHYQPTSMYPHHQPYPPVSPAEASRLQGHTVYKSPSQPDANIPHPGQPQGQTDVNTPSRTEETPRRDDRNEMEVVVISDDSGADTSGDDIVLDQRQQMHDSNTDSGPHIHQSPQSRSEVTVQNPSDASENELITDRNRKQQPFLGNGRASQLSWRETSDTLNAQH
ncbi:MAG: hypothetical protein ABW185_03820 [Sedimenticola sp.]